MGMFDRILVRCPVCAAVNELQTKSGPRLMYTYAAYAVPRDVSADLIQEWYYAKDKKGLITCEGCQRKLAVTVTPIIPTREMTLVQLHEAAPYMHTEEYEYDNDE